MLAAKFCWSKPIAMNGNGLDKELPLTFVKVCLPLKYNHRYYRLVTGIGNISILRPLRVTQEVVLPVTYIMRRGQRCSQNP